MEHPKERKERLAKEKAQQKEHQAKRVRFKLGILSEINKTGLASVRYKMQYLSRNPNAKTGTDLTVNEALEVMQDAIDHFLNKQKNESN